MSENNQMMSVQGQLIGMPLAGPESFSQQQLDYLKRAIGVDETVLWEGTGWALGDTAQSITLLESPLNFETIRVYMFRPLTANASNYSAVFSDDFDIQWLYDNSVTNIMLSYAVNTNGDCFIGGQGISGITTTSWTEAGGFHFYANTAKKTNGPFAHIHKVVGIHRIAGGNQ